MDDLTLAPAPPPDDPVWDAPLASAPRVFLDLETTGCDASVDRICEVAVHRVEPDGTCARWSSLVAPGVTVGASARIHGLTDAALADAPSLEALASTIDARLRGAVVVGHAVAFDLAFLAAAHARGELPPMPAVALDTRALAQRALRTGSTALAALAKDLGLPAPAHRADADVRATEALFAHLLEALAPRTARDLLDAQRLHGPATMRSDVEAVLAEALATGRDVALRYRVPGRDPFDDTFHVAALRPPWVDGWLVGRKARRTLRGDRILRAGLAAARTPG